MRIILLAVYLLLVLFPLSSYGGEPATLDEAVQLVKDLKAQGKSDQEIAEFVSKLVDTRIDNANTAEGVARRGSGWVNDEGWKTHEKWKELRDKAEQGSFDHEGHAKGAWDLRYGQCGETSAVAYYILKKAGYENVKILENSKPHQWVVIGMDPKADPNDPRTWGKDASVVDGWLGNSLNPQEAFNQKWIGNKGELKPGYATYKFDPKGLSQAEVQWIEKQDWYKAQAEAERQRKEAEAKKAEEEARRKAEEEARRKAEEEARRKAAEAKQAEEEAKRKAALDAALKQANELIATARTAAGRVQAVIGIVQGTTATGTNASSAAGAAEGAAQQAKGAAEAARSACAKSVSEGVIDAARSRAEAAASEVGTLYQDVVNLANETCQAAAQVQQASNAGARRVLTTKMEGLATRAQSRAASAQTALRRAQAEAGQATRQNAERQAAQAQSDAAKAALVAARGQVSAVEGVMNSYEATVTGAQGQVGTAPSEFAQVEQYKQAAMGVLAPFLSEPAAQALIPVINGVVPPAIDGLDQQLQTAMTTIQQARTRVKATLDQLTAWEGSVAACGSLAPTDSLAQAATAAASTAELFLPKVTAAAGRATQCAGAGAAGAYNPHSDPGMGGAPPDRQGAAVAGQGYAQGAPGAGKPPNAGALGGGQVAEQPGLKPPPPDPGDAGTAGPFSAQELWCYSEKTKEFYRVLYGPCPPPYMRPPPGTTRTAEPGGMPSWQGLLPPEGKPPMNSKPPVAGSGPSCPPGCHIKPGTNKCHCGGS